MKHILITGGAGYVGTVLTPRLLDAGYKVTVFDACYFGCFLEKHKNLEIVKEDIRNTERFEELCDGVDVVLHLACISNDPSFELNENLSKSINYDCFEGLVKAAKKQNVSRFVYCSSSSVYGVSEAQNVTEEHPLVPLTLYNKFKGMCEPILFDHQEEGFTCVAIRPATLCGYSPRMRFDLSVNILTNHAVNNGEIKVFGGAQLRPNLHVKDMCRVYEMMINAPEDKIAGEVFNIGYENKSIMDLALRVKDVVMKEFPEKGEITVTTTPTDDIRSYHISSEKIKKVLDFSPIHTIDDAIQDICTAFKEGKFNNSLHNDEYFNVKHINHFKVA